MSKKLFDASDESDNELQLGTNQGYAKSYNNFRKKELLKKFKDRGYNNVEESNSSEDTSDSSEEDEVLDPQFDQEFFKTLASLKSKDPTIYDKNTRFFDSLAAVKAENAAPDECSETNRKEKKSKPVTIKDYERKIILERGGKFEDDSDVEADVEYGNERAHSPTVVEEERRLKAEFKHVLNAEDSEEEEFGGIFKKRTKTKEENEQEEADFTKWLAGKQTEIEDNVKQKLEPLRNYWSNNKLPQSERFLRDYILNKGYAEVDTSEIPTYDEIVGDTAPLSEDEQELEKQAEFEQKFNFRYEEPDAEFIRRYPRTIENSVRRTDDKRKQKRQEQKQRKEQEKVQKMQELEMIRDMKRKEIEEKIRKLKLVTGNDELGFRDDELEDDFDPEAHDRRMQEIFNAEYYNVDEGEEKPDCPSDIEELKIEDWDNYDPRRGGDDDEYYEPHCEDDDFNMDCDYDPAKAKQQLQQELIDNTKGKRSRKGRKNRFMEMIQAEKPPFNPEEEQTYAEYIEEYYQLDCEDIIGDTPCRFKYVETVPNDFGLTIEEILLAKNKELNQWASLKKATQLRPDHLEKKEQRLYKMKAQNEELKRKIFKSLYGEGSDEEDDQEDKATNTKAQPTENSTSENDANATATNRKKSKKNKKRKAKQTAVVNESDVLEVKKPKVDDNVEKAEQSVEVTSAETPAATLNTDVSAASKKKRRKKKNKNGANQTTNNDVINRKPETVPTQNQSNNNKTIAEAKRTNNPFGQEVKPKLQNGNVARMPHGGKRKNKQATGAAESQVHKQKTTNQPTTAKRQNNPFERQKKPHEKVIRNGDGEIKRKPTAATSQDTPNTKRANNPFGGEAKLHKVQQGKVTKNSDRVGGGRKFSGKPNKFGNKKKFNAHPAGTTGDDKKITDDRLKAYGINPKKFHKKQKYGNKANNAK